MSDPELSDAKAALLERWRRGVPIAAAPRIAPRADRGPQPLSLAQERLWFIEQLQPGMATWNLFFCARVDGRLDPDRLAAAVAGLVARHEALRTTFLLREGLPVQAVDEGAAPVLEVVDLRDLDAEAGTAAALERVDRAIHLPFDLERGPLARVLLCRAAGGDVLGVVVHHLVGDGWSLGVALRDLAALYEGGPGALRPLPVQFGDVTAWQRAHAGEEDWREDLAHWRERLAGLEPLAVPADRPRPRVMTGRGDWCPLAFGQPLSDGLRRLARERDATLFMVLLTAWSALLAGMSGQRDVAVGANSANRGLPETFGLIGSFVNLLALRVDLAGDPTLLELLDRVRETVVNAFAHQRVPFERVVEELQPERDLSRSVLFQALLVLQPPTTELRFAGMDMAQIEVGSRTARADLELHLWDQPALAGRLVHSSDLYEPATIERLAARLRLLLEALAADPSRRLSQVSLVLPDEPPLLDAWAPGPERPAPAPVPELVRRQARRTPDALAVVAGDERLDYRTLERRTARLARHLRSLGAGADVPVGICLERTADLVVAALAVLRAGAAYVPLDPRLPGERLALVAADSRARLVVTRSDLADRVPLPAVCVDRDAVAIDAWPDDGPEPEIHPDQLAYVIYTSGSTGAPKGVQMPHRAMANFVSYQLETPGLGAGDVMSCVSSLSFDASVAELFPPLAAGGTLVLVPAEDAVDGERLRWLLLEHGATCVFGTPTTWRLLLAAGGLDDRRIAALCGAEAMSPELADALAAGHERAWNLYGPTETTVWCSLDRMVAGAPVSLGRPVANMRMRVLDAELRPVPIGVAGELCIGGPGLSRGYLGRPGPTAERFVPDPSGPPGSRLYRSGDLARRRLDGSLEFLGRRDAQVKLRGHRIELGEIEATLAAHPGVSGAVVLLHGAGTAEARLVAYVVPAPGEPPTTSALVRHVRDRLPDYMAPSSFLFLSEFPKTAGGKLDRLRLPVPDRERPALASEYVAPRTPREREIALFAAELLGLERVGVRDDFFDLGGHSLLAARLVSELRERYRVELVLQKLFLVPTVEHLAAMIDEELASQRHLADEDARLRTIVEGLPDAAVDSLLASLLPPGGRP